MGGIVDQAKLVETGFVVVVDFAKYTVHQVTHQTQWAHTDFLSLGGCKQQSDFSAQQDMRPDSESSIHVLAPGDRYTYPDYKTDTNFLFRQNKPEEQGTERV